MRRGQWKLQSVQLLICKLAGVGFTHGVLNTYNMSVLGLTIDYGPFGLLDAFDPSYTPNTTDLPGRRYGFANQPDICLSNIVQFPSTLSSAELINEKESNYAREREVFTNSPFLITAEDAGALTARKNDEYKEISVPAGETHEDIFRKAILHPGPPQDFALQTVQQVIKPQKQVKLVRDENMLLENILRTLLQELVILFGRKYRTQVDVGQNTNTS